MAYDVANRVAQVSRQDANLTLRLAESSGIDTLDTGISYGEIETCLDDAGIQNFKVVTKLPALPDDCADVSAWA